MNKLSAQDGGYGVSRVDGLVSPAYWVLRPHSPALDPRWLDYVLRAAPYKAEIARVSKQMPPAQFDVPWNQFRRIRVPMPGVQEQRAIADHLDTETARIDALIAKKQQLAGAVRERARARVNQLFSELQGESAPLGRFVRSLTQGESPQAGGVPAREGERGLLKLSAVKDGSFRPRENKVLATDVAKKAPSPMAGDLLVTRANTPKHVGDSCAVTEDYPNLAICDLIYRLRLTSDLDPEFAALCLGQPQQRGLFSALARGTSQSMVKLRSEDLRSVPVAVAAPGTQRDLVVRARAIRKQGDHVESALAAQTRLLAEHRQALITAAVTGELEIPRVAS